MKTGTKIVLGIIGGSAAVGTGIAIGKQVKKKRRRSCDIRRFDSPSEFIAFYKESSED